MAMSGDNGESLPWIVLNENLPIHAQVEDIAFESADARLLFPPTNIHSLQGVRERLHEFMRGNEYESVTENTSGTQIPPLFANGSDMVFATLENLAARRQEIIGEIEQSRQRLALNSFTRPPHPTNLSTVISFSNPATPQDVWPIFEYPNSTFAPLLPPGSIMPQQEDPVEERRPSVLENERIESNRIFAPLSLSRQNALVFPSHPHTVAGSGANQQSNTFAFTPFSWPPHETAPHSEQNLVQNITLLDWLNQERQQDFGMLMVTPNTTASPPYHGGLDDFGASQNSPNMVLSTSEWPNPQDRVYLGPNRSQSSVQENRTVEQGCRVDTTQMWSPLHSRTVELHESLDDPERRQAEAQSEIQGELQMQRAELRLTFHPPTGTRANNQPEHPPTILPALPREPVDGRTADPDAPPTPGRRAPHARQRRRLVNEASQDSHDLRDHEVGHILHLVSRERAETEPGFTNHNDLDHELSNISSRFSTPNFFTPSPRQFPRLTRQGDNDLEAEPDRLLSQYRTQGVSSSRPFHHSSNTRSPRHALDQWTDPDPRSQAQREIDSITSYLALIGCFTDSRAELHRIDDIESFISSVSNSSHRSRHSRPSSRHHPYLRHHPWTTSSQILTPCEFRSVHRSIRFRSAYGQRSGFRDRLDDAYGPIVGEWLWWVWLGAMSGSEEDEEVGWVDFMGRRVISRCEGQGGGVSGAGTLGAVREHWERGGGLRGVV